MLAGTVCAAVADWTQVPHDVRWVLRWLCDEASDAGLVRAVVQWGRGEWRKEELDRLEDLVGEEVHKALASLRDKCLEAERRGDRVGVGVLQEPRWREACASLQFLQGLGRRREWAEEWASFQQTQEQHFEHD